VAVNRTPWHAVGAAVVLVLATRLCVLIVGYQGAAGSIRRPHIESAALLLAVTGLAYRFATDRRADPDGSSCDAVPIAYWVVLSCGATILYWPALWVGLLSDDFILVQHASAWDASQVAPQLFRPLPIIVWAVIVHLGGGAVALHGLNILLHGTNAYLAASIVAGWHEARRWAAAAGLLVLLSPLAPEAVAWCAGVFDLCAAAFMMAAVLAARRYADRGNAPNILLLIGLCAGALLSKETAVMLPLLIALDAWVRGSLSKRVGVAVAALAGAIVLFAVIRLGSAGDLPAGGFSRYRFQRLIFDGFGGLAAPWHSGDTGLTVLRTSYALGAIALVTAFCVARGSRWRSRNAVAGSLWVVASILPGLPIFYVGPRLEGARYLYLAACGWAAVLIASASDIAEGRRLNRAFAAFVLLLFVAADTAGVRMHLRPWSRAAATRDVVLRSAAGDARLHACPVVYLQGLPDSLDGAYLFANGAREALAAVGVNAYARQESGPCAFRWEPKDERFAQQPR
jgi:hypothetical protein